jgi:hypothetical protein
MARLLRVHFASVGHPDARLAPLTLDLRARDTGGAGVDSVLWLRNGGGKSTILNLFYSLFRPDRRDFLGASAEGRARHLEDYVKADDLAFVVTEWDVEPVAQTSLFGVRPGRRRVVGQVLSWKDREKSHDVSKLRRRFFSFVVSPLVGFDELPVDGLGPSPVRSHDAFRLWLDTLRQDHPELEPFSEDTPRKWTEHLEKIGLDPELFRYQLKMNAREGSADEAFRFRTTEEFIRFYLEIAFDTGEADQVSANLEGYRGKLERRPALMAEQGFLLDARGALLPLSAAMTRLGERERRQVAVEREGRSVLAAMIARRDTQAAQAHVAQADCAQAAAAAKEAENQAAKLGRWANGLDRRAIELDLAEAEAAARSAETAAVAAEESMHVSDAAVMRDVAARTQAERDAKAQALAAARLDQEPLRRELARVGTTLRARLSEAAETERERAEASRRAGAAARVRRDACDARQRTLDGESAGLAAVIAQVDDWLADRDRERERLRANGIVELRQDAMEAGARWADEARAQREAADRHRLAHDEARRRRQLATGEEKSASDKAAHLGAVIAAEIRRVDEATQERDRIAFLTVVREREGETPDLDAPGLSDRLLAAAEATRQQLLVAAVDGAEDARARRALDETGRLPPSPDVERTLATLKASGVTAWSAAHWLAENEPNSQRQAELAASDPALWHGVVVPDGASVDKARAMLATHLTRHPVVVARVRLDSSPSDGRLAFPGDAAHWDTAAGARLAEELGDRERRRERDRQRLADREQALREATGSLAQWRDRWGDGRLARANSDLDQRVAERSHAEHERDAASVRAHAEETRQQKEEAARRSAEAAAISAEGNASRVADFVERYERRVHEQRHRKDSATVRRAAIVRELMALAAERVDADDTWLQARDQTQAHEANRTSLLTEHDTVDLSDALAPADLALEPALITWATLRKRWERVVSDDRLQWELEQLEARLLDERGRARTLSRGREHAVAAVEDGEGERQRTATVAANEAAKLRKAMTRTRLTEASNAAQAAQAALRRREADDLPPGPPPDTADLARSAAARCRADRDQATERSRRESDRASNRDRERRDAEAEADRCKQRQKRLVDQLGDAGDAAPSELGDDIDALVDARLLAVREASRLAADARNEAHQLAEALRSVATAPRHEAHRSRVKERLKAPPAELALVAAELVTDVESRLEIVHATLGEIDEDRRLVLTEIEKIAMDGVRLLHDAEKASRLPAGLQAWEGEPFLRIRANVSAGQLERRARLEPLLDRLVAKGHIPEGRELVLAAVLELAGQRVDATILKPDALLRRDRLPVVEMQTFSRGQQLTVAILLYCTLAQLRSRSRGHRGPADGGVLLLDNPVGTCSSVHLLELQRTVARQMRVQLVYTTGVNDPDAIATFPNTVRLRNHHRAQATGDLHVTIDGVESVRIVST